MPKEAKARILINDLLMRSGWRFFDDAAGPSNIALEAHVKLKQKALDDLGDDFEKTASGFVDYLLLDERGFPVAVLEAKSQKFDPLVGKEKARKYAHSQNARFVILSNGSLNYFWDLEQGNPVLITQFPTPESLDHFHAFKPNPDSLVKEKVEADFVAITQNPNYRNDARWNDPAQRDAFIKDAELKFLRPYQLRLTELRGGAGVPGLNRNDAYEKEIPLPPLAEQERLVAELEGYRKVIEAARQVIANYKPTIRIDPQWPMVKLGEVCERIQYGLSEKLNTNGIGYRTFRMNELVDGRAVDNGEMKRVEVSEAEFKKYRLEKGDILFNRTNSFEHVGRTGIFSLDGDYAFASYLIRLIVDRKQVNPEFVNAYMNTAVFQQAIKTYASRAIGQANISASSLEQGSIPLPPLKMQHQIVAELEAERALVEANRELIARFEQKMQAKLAEIWGEEGV